MKERKKRERVEVGKDRRGEMVEGTRKKRGKGRREMEVKGKGQRKKERVEEGK